MSSPTGTLAKALKHHRAGALQEARRLYLRILASNPRDPEALHLLGVAAHQAGRHDEAIESINKAIRLAPGRPEYHNDLGDVLRALKRFSEARKCVEEALRLRPDYAEAHNNLGLIIQDQGRINDAIACFHKAIQLKPDFAEPYNHLGIIAHSLRRLDEALELFQKAIQINPRYTEAHSNRGIVYLSLDKAAEAAACFEEALRLNPRYHQAHNNLGITRQIEGRLDEALACFRESIRLRPDSPEAHNSAGNVLRLLERNSEALASYQEALRLRGDYFEARANLDQLLAEQGPSAEAGVEQAVARAPSDALKVLSLLRMSAIPESLDSALRERRRFEENLARLREESLTIDEPVRELGNLLFYLAYQGMNDRALMTELAAFHVRTTPSLSYVAPHCVSPAAPDADGRIRVGFISRSFYNHTNGKLNAGLIRLLSRQRFRVTIFTFPGHEDDWWTFIREGADSVVMLPLDLEESRRKIADERLDVLFYTDIGMDPWTYFLAYARLAPVQCVTWGHPNTTGIPTIDYFLSARDLEPDDDADHYSERLVVLDNLPTYYYRTRLPASFRPRSFFGLEERDHLYVCPQSLFKFHPEFDAFLDGILRADARGRIVLVAGHQDHWNQLLMKRFRGSLGWRADRITMLPRQSEQDFLSLLAIADVLLDPIHFGSGNTAFEAFAVGTPLVTTPGRFMRSRITYACYRRMGVMDCVAADAEEYVRLAVRLGTDADWRAQVRARILASKDVLFENPGIIGELEQFFLTARMASEFR